MTVGLVLSGGGAKGSFQVGALQRLYEENLFAPVISGCSVGAINGAKLAEGGQPGSQKAAFGELKSIWDGLRTDEDMFLKTPWLKELEEILENRVFSELEEELRRVEKISEQFASSDLGAIASKMPDAFEAPMRWYSFANRLLPLVPKIQGLVPDILNAHSIYTLEPMVKRLRGQDPTAPFNTAKVASSGVKLRLAVVALESGDLRWVTEAGNVTGTDGVTPHEEIPPGIPTQCQGLNNTLIQKKKEREADYQEWLKELAKDGALDSHTITQKAQVAVAKQDQEIVKLRQQLTECVAKHTAAAPLKVPLSEGILASSSIPAVFQAVLLGREHYVDGGTREIVPVQGAARAGADHVIAISASPLTASWQPWAYPATYRIPEIAKRGLELALTEVAVTDLAPEPAVLVAPRFEVHDMMRIERGLVRINMDYGYMCDADAIGLRRRFDPSRDPLTGTPAPSTLGPPQPLPFPRRPSPPIDVHHDRAPYRLWPMSADVITKLRMVAWKLEEILHIVDTAFTVFRPLIHGYIRTTKGIIHHLVEARAAAGAPGPNASETDPWWGGWELHTGFELPLWPSAARGGYIGPGSGDPVRFVRDESSKAVYKLVGLFRHRLSTSQALSNAGAAAANAPELPANILAELPEGTPLTR